MFTFKDLFRKRKKTKENLLKSNELKSAIAKAIKTNLLINNKLIKGGEDYTCISIGENCNSSWYLKETGNKSLSYPFDWLFTSPKVIYDIVNNNFDTFLNKKYIVEKKNKISAGHTLYHDSLFNHKNPLKSSKDFFYYEQNDLPTIKACSQATTRFPRTYGDKSWT